MAEEEQRSWDMLPEDRKKEAKVSNQYVNVLVAFSSSLLSLLSGTIYFFRGVSAMILPAPPYGPCLSASIEVSDVRDAHLDVMGCTYDKQQSLENYYCGLKLTFSSKPA